MKIHAWQLIFNYFNPIADTFAMLILAEIADKMPTETELWAIGLVLTVVAVSVLRSARWAWLLVLPITIWLAWGGYNEAIAENSMRDSIIRELGVGYHSTFVVTSWLPLISALVFLLYGSAVRRRRLALPC